MRGKADKRRGQILIMATLVSIPLFGMLGLVTDLGYMHYVKMTAQSAAEAAAQSAIINFHATVGGATFSCNSGTIACTNGTPATCDPGTAYPSIHDGRSNEQSN